MLDEATDIALEDAGTDDIHRHPECRYRSGYDDTGKDTLGLLRSLRSDKVMLMNFIIRTPSAVARLIKTVLIKKR